MSAIPFVLALALFVTAVAVRIARPPVDPSRFRGLAITITANTEAFQRAMADAALAIERFSESIQRLPLARREAE